MTLLVFVDVVVGRFVVWTFTVEVEAMELLSSPPPGSGSNLAFSASTASPHNVILQSTKVPLTSFLTPSMMIIVQVPTPSSPLILASGNNQIIGLADLEIPVLNTHKGPIVIALLARVGLPLCCDVADDSRR